MKWEYGPTRVYPTIATTTADIQSGLAQGSDSTIIDAKVFFGQSPLEHIVDARLAEIDEMCGSIQQYFSEERLRQLTHERLEDGQGLWHEMQAAGDTYDEIASRLDNVLHDLAGTEIAEGYVHGCALMQALLSGRMRAHIRPEFVPVMVDAVRNDHRAAYLFLGALRGHLDTEEFIALLLCVVETIKSGRTLDTALAYVAQLQITKAIPSVTRLLSHDDPRIARLAGTTLDVLQST